MKIVSSWILRTYFDPDSTYVGVKWRNDYAVCAKEVKLYGGFIRYEDVMDVPVEVVEALADVFKREVRSGIPEKSVEVVVGSSKTDVRLDTPPPKRLRKRKVR